MIETVSALLGPTQCVAPSFCSSRNFRQSCRDIVGVADVPS